MADDIETRTLTTVAWRFIPFLIVCYFVAYQAASVSRLAETDGRPV